MLPPDQGRASGFPFGGRGFGPGGARGGAAPPALVALAVVVLTVWSWSATQIAFAALDAGLGQPPDPHALPADSLIFDRAGRLIADVHPPSERRFPVTLNLVSPMLQKATVDVEDRNFWHEGATDAPRVAAAAWNDLLHASATQGGSTITEQLARLLFLDPSRSLERKVRELFVARHLDATMSKEAILREYLNDIYYGHGAYGVEAASEEFFRIPAQRLDLAQASLLAGLPNDPSGLDPVTALGDAKARQREVLDAMVDAGDADAADADRAFAEDLHVAPDPDQEVDTFPAVTRRAVAEVRAQLHLDPLTAGLRITTTIDSGLQAAAQRSVTAQVDAERLHQVSDGALVAVDPATGGVVAYVGDAGPGHPGSEIDMAARPRQSGSTFKLFTYSAAIAHRTVTMLSPVEDAPLRLPSGGGAAGTAPYTVRNYDLAYHGRLPVKEALGNSLNVPAVKVEMAVGIPAVLQTARAMGVTALDQPDNAYGASLTLGTYPLPLDELAQAGSVLAAGGTLHPAHLLASVTDSGGRPLPLAPDQPRQALDAGAAFVMNAILSDDANRRLEFGAQSALTVPGHVVAAKTGTTSDSRDNLTVGWTPGLVVATWVGNADDSPMRDTTGLSGAAPIWRAVMESALGPAGRGDGWPGPPGDVTPAPGGGWLLSGTTGAPQAVSAVGRSGGGCRTWSVGNSHYWYCGTGASGLPGDPGPAAAPPPPPPAQPAAPAPPTPPAPGGATNVRQDGQCRYWTYQGSNYWYCGTGASGLPGDPGAPAPTPAPQ